MPAFNYSAVNQKGDRISGSVDAVDRAAVIKTLTGQDLQPLSLKEVSSSDSRQILKDIWWWQDKK